MRIAFLSAEVTPFAKTGGLADVAGVLPDSLRRHGHEVRVYMPLYRQVALNGHSPQSLPLTVDVALGTGVAKAGFARIMQPGCQVPVYFVDCPRLFDRAGLYQEKREGALEAVDYSDNLERFAFYCRAVMEALRADDWRPDVLHCNDWQAALALVYLKTLYANDPVFARTRCLLTVHNLAYQGAFPREQYPILGLPWDYFGIQGLEFYGKVNLLKGGLLFADHINTVSKQYAKEICTPEFGCGLEGVLQQRAADLSGILNGADYMRWDPRHDTMIAAQFGPDNLQGKAVNKAALQEAFGLKSAPQVPLLGVVSRLDRQKGLELIIRAFPKIAALGAQLVVLGTGDGKLEKQLRDLVEDYPQQLGIKIEFDEKLAHMVEAGADVFLMPSLYEPCGLNQMYSLRYGTIPVVRKTGGLADTVANFSDKTGKGNGFVFTKPTPGELFKAVRRAVQLYRKDKPTWTALMRQAMALDFSWSASADGYNQLYRRLQRQASPPVS